MFRVEPFYVLLANGDFMLVEIFKEGESIVLTMGEKRLDLMAESVFELADALLMATTE